MIDKSDLLSNYIYGEIENLPLLLDEKTHINGKKLNKRYEYTTLTNYIDDFLNNKYNKRFIMLSGLRGAGKTVLLYQIYEYLLENHKVSSNQILYFSCEDVKNLTDSNIKEIVEIFVNFHHDTSIESINKKIFLLIDNAQYDENWSLTGKELYDLNKNIFMIFTGSFSLNFNYNPKTTMKMIKHSVTPLNYSDHIKLKYNQSLNISKSIKELLFDAKVDEAVKNEYKVFASLINNMNYLSKDWDDYFKYGGLPSCTNETNHRLITEKLLKMMNEVINIDMVNIKNFTSQNQAIANRILRYLAFYNPDDLSQNKLAKELNTSSANVNSIIDILEKTNIIFHCEAYGNSFKKSKKSWKYYFITSSLKNALCTKINSNITNTYAYDDILLENMVAAILTNFKNRDNKFFTLFADANRKNQVDFLLHYDYLNPVPIKLGSDVTDKKLLLSFMNHYDSTHGILISEDFNTIFMEDDIIHISPKTLSFL